MSAGLGAEVAPALAPTASFAPSAAARWLAAALYVDFIFWTLPYAPLATGAIRRQFGPWALGGATVAVAALAFGVAVRGVARRPAADRTRGGLALAALAVVSALLFAWLAEQPNEVVHLVEYGLLAVLVLRAGRASGGIVRHPAFALAATAALGFVDEITQGVSPNRYFGWHDVAANALSGALGLGWLGVLEGADVLRPRPYWLCRR
jgi:hypothetical protein